MKYILALVILILPLTAYTQTPDSLSTKYSGSINLSGNYQSGNTNKFYLEGKGDIRRVSQNLEMILAATYGYGENKFKKDDNILLSIFTADLFYKRNFSPFILQVIEYNFSKGIDLRSQSGAGLKYVLIPEKKNKTSVSLAVIYDKTKLAVKPGNYDIEEVRLSFRVKTRQEIIESRLIISAVGFYQPVVNDFSRKNYRVDAQLEIPVSETISGHANYSYSFDDVVSVGRKRADNKLTFGFKIGFGE